MCVLYVVIKTERAITNINHKISKCLSVSDTNVFSFQPIHNLHMYLSLSEAEILTSEDHLSRNWLCVHLHLGSARFTGSVHAGRTRKRCLIRCPRNVRPNVLTHSRGHYLDTRDTERSGSPCRVRRSPADRLMT